MSTALKFEDPGPEPLRSGGSAGKYIEVLVELRKFPNRWIRLAEFSSYQSASQAAARFTRGEIVRPSGPYEFTSRPDATSNGKRPNGLVFARYTGGPDDPFDILSERNR